MHRATQIRSIVVAATLLVSGTLLQSRPVLAQSTDATTVEPAAQDSTSFDRTEVMIQMRDGVKLHTLVFSPKNAAEPLPIIMTRTPYGIAGSGRQLHTPAWSDLEHDGYILVFQDIRGRYESGGKFVMLRTMRNKRDPKSIDESTDAYDTIAWLLKHVANNNGRVGMTGTSYPGWLTVMA
ncbi:MAG: CocE/NonD family hydrolase, partial [Gemmatimonadaceae bacterium]